ncbi:MAG TPA: hypothetical protein DD490_32015 [Acidobacteria bacterium]|nr:hypothetical protein [Acidobacteriota bacterium]
MSTSIEHTVAGHFTGKAPAVRAIYDRILAAAREMGTVEEEAKKTSIHLVHTTAFAGIATRKEALILTLKSSRDIASPRVTKHEQASANRWHLEVKLSAPEEVDAELCGWLAAAFALQRTV